MSLVVLRHRRCPHIEVLESAFVLPRGQIMRLGRTREKCCACFNNRECRAVLRIDTRFLAGGPKHG